MPFFQSNIEAIASRDPEFEDFKRKVAYIEHRIALILGVAFIIAVVIGVLMVR